MAHLTENAGNGALKAPRRAVLNLFTSSMHRGSWREPGAASEQWMDVDLFRFVASSGTTLTATLSVLSGALDSVLRLFDAAGNELLIDNRTMRFVGVVPERSPVLWSSPLVDNSTLFATPEIWLRQGDTRIFSCAQANESCVVPSA